MKLQDSTISLLFLFLQTARKSHRKLVFANVVKMLNAYLSLLVCSCRCKLVFMYCKSTKFSMQDQFLLLMNEGYFLSMKWQWTYGLTPLTSCGGLVVKASASQLGGRRFTYRRLKPINKYFTISIE